MKLNERDNKALGEFITTCYNLNIPIDNLLSEHARIGFETACDYYQTNEVFDLKQELMLAVKYLKEGKTKFAPNTTNSFVDDFIAKHNKE